MINMGNSQYMIPIGLTGLVLALVYGLYLYSSYWKVKRFRTAGIDLDAMTVGSKKIRFVKKILVFVTIFLFAVTLLRPQWDENFREVNSDGTDVLVILDVSKSMMANDVSPSRLQRAKSAVKWIASSLKGDRMGLVLFAGDAFLQCPLTRDMGAFLMFLDAASPESITKQGTDIGKALSVAYRVFQKKRMTSRMMILITDGEDHEKRALAMVEPFRKANVSIFTVGVGRESGSTIPAMDDITDTGIYAKDRDGHKITTRKDAGSLKKLAALTGGSYLDITYNLSDLSFIMEIIREQQRKSFDTMIIKEPKEQFTWPALLLVILLLLELAVPEISWRARKPLVRKNPFIVIKGWIDQAILQIQRGFGRDS